METSAGNNARHYCVGCGSWNCGKDPSKCVLKVEYRRYFNWHSILDHMHKNRSTNVQLTLRTPKVLTEIVEEIKQHRNLSAKEIFSVGGTKIFTITEHNFGFAVIMLPNCGVNSRDSNSNCVVINVENGGAYSHDSDSSDVKVIMFEQNAVVKCTY